MYMIDGYARLTCEKRGGMLPLKEKILFSKKSYLRSRRESRDRNTTVWLCFKFKLQASFNNKFPIFKME